ncbi:MAG TPA: hypothetical protein VFV67_13810 [Actinophytocola sp.]|uniref:hypothetical protein n=1 Tax=Actinophytocola sp. TaxID=1872138 RepID=UPI002DB8541B|nr:hypothetical protein [Actinophytocola sp.]HEU5471722.1 hypothetical protein [Actinophytocola sp.]
MAQLETYPPGGRRVVRPATVTFCPNCGELVGRGYPDCVICAERIDDLWWADWQVLLESEKIRPGTDEEGGLARKVLSDEVGRHPWTCTDWALWLLRCGRCGGQLGSGDSGCMACAAADQARWAWDYQALPDAMTPNEHALRVAVAGLRAPHRHRGSVVTGWRLALPFLFVGDLPTTAQTQRIRGHVLAGRYAELARQQGFAAMACLPDLPWRAQNNSGAVHREPDAQPDQH